MTYESPNNVLSNQVWYQNNYYTSGNFPRRKQLDTLTLNQMNMRRSSVDRSKYIRQLENVLRQEPF